MVAALMEKDTQVNSKETESYSSKIELVLPVNQVKVMLQSKSTTHNDKDHLNCLSMKCHSLVSITNENNLWENNNGVISLHLSVTSLKNPPTSQTIVSVPNLDKKEEKPVPANTTLRGHQGGKLDAYFEGDNDKFDSTDLLKSNDSDGKKQASILKYFFPIKKVVKDLSYKNSVNPKSLRSNRFLSSSMGSLTPNRSIKMEETASDMCNQMLNNNSFRESSGRNSSFNSSKEMANTIKTSSHKRKFSSFIKRKQFLDLSSQKIKPSMMENLIKQTSEKLKLHYQITQRKRKISSQLSQTKPCSVVLKRMRSEHFIGKIFTGWDFDCNEFCGFGEPDLTKAQETYNKYKQFIIYYKNFQISSSEEEDIEGFRGFHDKKDEFTGTSGLVQIAFMIDKLSNGCVDGYQID